jgi:hypothetical protein
MHYDGLDGMAKEADAIGGRLIDGTNRIAASRDASQAIDNGGSRLRHFLRDLTAAKRRWWR